VTPSQRVRGGAGVFFGRVQRTATGEEATSDTTHPTVRSTTAPRPVTDVAVGTVSGIGSIFQTSNSATPKSVRNWIPPLARGVGVAASGRLPKGTGVTLKCAGFLHCDEPAAGSARPEINSDDKGQQIVLVDNQSPRKEPSTSQRIADYLREAILSGEIPPGSRIRQEEIAQRLGTSRLPVREALRMLEVGDSLTSK
jgi:hypothetical protein